VEDCISLTFPYRIGRFFFKTWNLGKTNEGKQVKDSFFLTRGKQGNLGECVIDGTTQRIHQQNITFSWSTHMLIQIAFNDLKAIL
jgi:hypothetical protein